MAEVEWRDLAMVLAGSCLLLLVQWDLWRTTLGVLGGPVTRQVSTALWRGVHLLCNIFRCPWQQLRHLGMFCVVGVLCSWIVLIFLGWFLLSQPLIELRDSSRNHVVDEWRVFLYFTGTSLLTLGPGDFVATNFVGQMCTLGMTITGLLSITYAITGIIPVTQASLFLDLHASRIADLGGHVDGMVERIVKDIDSEWFRSHVADIVTSFSAAELKMQAYPVISYMPAVSARYANTLQPSRLAVALHLLRQRRAALFEKHRVLHQLQQKVVEHCQQWYEKLPAVRVPPPSGHIQSLESVAMQTHLGRILCHDRWIWNEL